MSIENLYTVKDKDCAWKIAKMNVETKGGKATGFAIAEEMKRLAKINNCDSVDDFNKKFFSKIGLELNLGLDESDVGGGALNADLNKTVEKPSSNKPAAAGNKSDSVKNWKDIQQEYKRINSLPDDKSKVLAWHKQNPTDQNFVIVDKKACKAIVYSPNGEELTSFMVGLGREKGDDYMKPNNVRPMTTSGIYTIDAQGTGKDGYARLYNDNIFTLTLDRGGATGIALHQIPNGNKARAGVNNDGNLENNRYSNGCVNFEKADFDKLEEFIDVGAKVYILPEDDNNYLMVKNGQLNLTQKKYTGEVMTSKKSTDYSKIQIKGKFTGESKQFAQGLVNYKKSLMKDLGIDNDTYNDLAKLSLGIAGQESKFGDSTWYSLKENYQDSVSVVKSWLGNNSYNSRGLTQMKLKSYTDPKVKSMFKKYGITEDSLSDPKKSAVATMIVLSCMQNEVPRSVKINKMDALLYIWNNRKSELLKGTATPDLNGYILNVRDYASKFDILQEQKS